MDVRQLRYFKAVIEAGSFTRAADHVRVAQPALGLQIRKLEDELGAQLMVRHSRGVDATEAGKVLLHHANVVLRQIERARQDVIDLTAKPKGTVEVGITPTASALLITPLVRLCHQTWPEISLRIVEGLSEVVMQQLVEHTLDIGFTYNPDAISGTRAKCLLVEDLYLVRPPGRLSEDSVPFADACREPLILPRGGFGLREQIETAAAARDLGVDVALEVNSVAAMRNLVEGGVGSTILPYGTIEPAVSAGRLSAALIVDPLLSRRLFLAEAVDHVETNASRAVKELVDTVAADIVATSEGRLRTP